MIQACPSIRADSHELPFGGLVPLGLPLPLELELELIQTHMAQKPLLWVEVGAHAVRNNTYLSLPQPFVVQFLFALQLNLQPGPTQLL